MQHPMLDLMRILVVEDDKKIASFVVNGLKQSGFAADKVLFSPNTIGHGAASSTVFRVDPDHQLVIAVARRQAGKNYDQHLSQFLQAVDDALRPPTAAK